MQTHLDKLNLILAQKSELVLKLDDSNKLQQEHIANYKSQLSALELKLSTALTQAQYDRDQQFQERQDLQSDYEQRLAQAELRREKEVKDVEREKKRVMREFEGLKRELLEKEQGVKKEIERVWGEWEERCAEVEDSKVQAEYRVAEGETRMKEMTRQVQAMKREVKE